MTRHVISFHYTLTDKTGKILDSSNGGEPMLFLEGGGQIIPGLEEALIVLKKGEKKKIHVPYQEAHGPFDENLIFEIARSKFPTQAITTGDMFEMRDGQKIRLVTVMKVEENNITINANHPLAGEDLSFDIEIIDVRQATPEEIAHGHIHGHGGHNH